MKKCLYLVLSLMMLFAVPMTVSANAEDDSSVTATKSTSTTSKKSTSPKTADNGMSELAIALLAISGGVLCFAKKELDRA